MKKLFVFYIILISSCFYLHGQTIQLASNIMGDTDPGGMYVFNGQLYFRTCYNLGQQPWVTDGKFADAKQLYGEINVGTFSAMNGKVYFGGYNISGRYHGLYATDGTDTGTKLVAMCNAIITDIPNCVLNNKLYFYGSSYLSGLNGNELWVSDGTDTGTKMFLDINKNNSGGCNVRFMDIPD